MQPADLGVEPGSTINPEQLRGPKFLERMCAAVDGAVPVSNPAFAQWGAKWDHNVEVDKARFEAAIAGAKNLPGQGGYYDDDTHRPKPGVRVGDVINALNPDAQRDGTTWSSKVTDISTITVEGHTWGNIYRTEDGHVTIGRQSPDGTVTHDKAGYDVNLKVSAEATVPIRGVKVSAKADIGGEFADMHETKGPVQPQVEELKHLHQLPWNAVVQPDKNSHSRPIFSEKEMPHQRQQEFWHDVEPPRPYAFSKMPGFELPLDKPVFDKMFSKCVGSNVTLFNDGQGGLGVQLQQQKQNLNLAR
jgi:hypothetical protein